MYIVHFVKCKSITHLKAINCYTQPFPKHEGNIELYCVPMNTALWSDPHKFVASNASCNTHSNIWQRYFPPIPLHQESRLHIFVIFLISLWSYRELIKDWYFLWVMLYFATTLMDYLKINSFCLPSWQYTILQFHKRKRYRLWADNLEDHSTYEIFVCETKGSFRYGMVNRRKKKAATFFKA